MATFSNLLETMRREVFTKAAVNMDFDDEELGAVLFNASSEIAAHFGFPIIEDATITWLEDATSFIAPADMVWPISLVVNNSRVELKHVEFVRGKQTLPKIRSPRFFAFEAKYNPGGARNFLFAPPANQDQNAGTVVLTYVRAIDTSSYPVSPTWAQLRAQEAWDGLFPDFHWLIPLKAGLILWASMNQIEQAAGFAERFNQGMQTFSTRLAATNVANLMVPKEARHDKGSVHG